MDADAILNSGHQLYNALRNMPCFCTTRWFNGERKMITRCQRCRVLIDWEELTQLTDRIPQPWEPLP